MALFWAWKARVRSSTVLMAAFTTLAVASTYGFSKSPSLRVISRIFVAAASICASVMRCWS